MKRLVLQVLLIALLLAGAASAQEVVLLPTDSAPNPAPAQYPEKEYFSTTWNSNVYSNVSQPSLTVFKPAAGLGIGTGIVICPGGGFMALNWEIEGTQVAQYLAARGVTAFVLKYRLAQTEGDATAEFRPLFADQAKFDAMVKTVAPLAIADGLTAVTWVRANAAKYGVAPDRVGIIGFSAGGSVTAEVAFHYAAAGRPAFVGAIYEGGMVDDPAVPSDAPPLFIASATDDTLGLMPQSVALYQKWTGAQKSAEMHVYAKGGHGFGMTKQNIPTDHWIDRFAEWLQIEGFLNK